MSIKPTVHDQIADQYDETAQTLEREARDLRLRAKKKRAQSEWARSMNAWREMAVCVRQLTLQGETLEAALEKTARQFKTYPATVQAYVDKERKEDKFVQRWWRDREMMRLAYTGMTNKEVGARLGITEQWVSTLIQRRLREGWALTKTLGEFHQYHRK